MNFCINALSANGQCHSIEDCMKSISNTVTFFEYCLPAIKTKRLNIYYDYHIESRHLRYDENFQASINNCKSAIDGKDLVDKWYLYTRNGPTLPDYEEIEVTLKSSDTSQSPITGTISNHFYVITDHWISLSGDEICDQNDLTFAYSAQEKRIQNHVKFDILKLLLPVYEPSDKHRRDAYEAGGVVISAMPLNRAEAQELILTSIPDDNGKKRWAFHKPSGKFYCFQKTQPGDTCYHGYQIEHPSEEIRRLLTD